MGSLFGVRSYGISGHGQPEATARGSEPGIRLSFIIPVDASKFIHDMRYHRRLPVPVLEAAECGGELIGHDDLLADADDGVGPPLFAGRDAAETHRNVVRLWPTLPARYPKAERGELPSTETVAPGGATRA